MKKIISALIAALFIISVLSCGEDSVSNPLTDSQNTAESDGMQSENQPQPVYGRANMPDTLDGNLDFGGRTVRIPYRNDTPNASELIADSETGELINDAVYRRNLAVEERLNVNLEFIALGTSPGEADKTVLASITAGSDDYDLFAARFYDTAMNHVQGYYRDVSDAPHLDFEQPWWFYRLMKDVAVGEDKIFMMLGEISQSSMLAGNCIYFNKNMYSRIKSDPSELYQSVFNGEWTIDRLSAEVKGVYSDVNGDGKADFDDIYGIYLGTASTSQYFIYSTGASFTKRDENNLISLDLENRGIFDMYDKVYSFFSANPDAYTFIGDVNFNDNAWVGFSSGRALFMPSSLRAAGNTLRVMEEDFGILPMPKYTESVENYTTFIQPARSIYTIPITTAIFDTACATLEAMCAETYRTVTPAVFEIALKDKYLRDEVSSQMLDLIVNSSQVDFLVAYFSAGAGTIASDIYTQVAKGPDLASLITSKKGATQAVLDNIITYYIENE